MSNIEFYSLLSKVMISFFCGFIIGIERTRQSAQYGARDHIFFAIISTSLVIIYENYVQNLIIWILIIIFGGMVVFLLIGSIYRLFHENDSGYTTTLSMILAMVVGILSYYNYLLSIAIAIIFLIILSTKKQFYKVKELHRIEWTGTVEFIAIVVLVFLLIPDNIIIVNINLRSIAIIFITILAIKYFSYFLLQYSSDNTLYYISLLGGFAHSEATTVQLAEIGAEPSSIWLVIQTMLIRMILILLLGALTLLRYAFLPITITVIVGLFGSFLILKNKETSLKFTKIKNPISIKSAIIFTGTYAIALFITLILDFYIIRNFIFYLVIAFIIGLFSGGASSLFIAASFVSNLINSGQALLLLTFGLSAAILNKIFYYYKFLNEEMDRKKCISQIFFYQFITITLLFTTVLITINLLSLPF